MRTARAGIFKKFFRNPVIVPTVHQMQETFFTMSSDVVHEVNECVILILIERNLNSLIDSSLSLFKVLAQQDIRLSHRNAA